MLLTPGPAAAGLKTMGMQNGNVGQRAGTTPFSVSHRGLVLRRKTGPSRKCWARPVCRGTAALVLSSLRDRRREPGDPGVCWDTNPGNGTRVSPAAPTTKTAAPPRATFSMAPNVPRVIFNLSG